MNQFISPYGQNMRSRSANIDWIIVQSVEQVENVAVQPGQKAWIMVQNEPIFALRTADMMGLCNTEYYRFEKYEPIPKAQAQQYVTIEQFENLKESINESLAKLANTATEPIKNVKRKTDAPSD